MKVCRAFQTRSKAGILSAKNSMTNSAVLATMTGQPLEQMESWGKGQMAEAGQQAEDGDGGVEVQAGGESDRGQQREEFRGRDLKDVQHRWRDNWGRIHQRGKAVPHRVLSVPV